MGAGKLGVCVVGLGVGLQHAQAYGRIHDVVDAYLCDTDRVRLVQARDSLGGVAGVFDSLDDVLASDRVQALDISLPNYLHAQTAIRASKVGKHVLVEKPMGTSLDETRLMIEEAKKAGTILGVGENWQFLPTTLKTIELLDSGLIGRPFLATVYSEMWPAAYAKSSWWFRKDHAGGGVLISAGVHAVRTLRMLARSQVAQIHAYGSNAATGIEAEDTVVISAKFENGMLGSIIASWATPRQPLLFSVYGPEGSIECGRAFEGLVLMDKSHDSASMKIPVHGADTIEEECRAFVKSIVEGKTDPRISPEEGRKDIEFVEAAYASMSKGGVVDLPMV